MNELNQKISFMCVNSDVKDDILLEDKETLLVFAFGYISIVDIFLDDYCKGILRSCIAYFNFSGYTSKTYQILKSAGILNENQLNLVLNCLFDPTLRTRLIIKIAARGILSIQEG